MTQGLLSVVVPTRNSGEIIAECLSHLLDLSYRPLEIIVLDQSTNDLTRQAFERVSADAHERQIAMRYVHSERKGLDAARNDGVAQTHGEWVAFADDDALVEKEWAGAIVRAFESDSQVGMVFGQTRPYYPPEAGKRTRIATKVSPRRQVFARRWAIIGRSAGPGNNMAIARSVFEHVGSFDERLGVGTDLPGGDEYEMSYRVLKSGYKIVYSPHAVSHHKRWVTEEKSLKIAYGYYTGHAAALIKHCRRLDGIALVFLMIEGTGRLAEIPYHAFITRDKRNVERAFVRARGFFRGLRMGWHKFDSEGRGN